MTGMGRLVAPSAWCRQRWCRSDGEAEHFAGDGCTCGPHGRAEGEPGRVLLTTKAARLSAFGCRVCGENTRRMIEQPSMFFRCEPCAAEGRWPELETRLG